MANSDLGAIAEVVPQISYDILGRIVPGSVVLVSLWVAAVGPGPAIAEVRAALGSDNPGPGVWTALLWIALAYVLAIVLNGVWQIPACWRRWRSGGGLARSIVDSTHKPSDPSFGYKFEVINQKLPKAGAWFTKLHAEMNLTRVIAVGWTIAAAVNSYFLLAGFDWPRLWLDVALVGGTAGALVEGSSIHHTRSDSLESLWMLLKSGELASLGIVSELDKEKGN